MLAAEIFHKNHQVRPSLAMAATRVFQEGCPGSSGIRTHTPEETEALIQRLRPLGHANLWERSRGWDRLPALTWLKSKESKSGRIWMCTEHHFSSRFAQAQQPQETSNSLSWQRCRTGSPCLSKQAIGCGKVRGILFASTAREKCSHNIFRLFSSTRRASRPWLKPLLAAVGFEPTPPGETGA